MKTLFSLLAFVFVFSSNLHAQYLGSWKIDDFLTFSANTHTASTGACSDAGSVATYRIYEDETSTPIVTGSMALLDSSNTCGFYTERIQLTAASGFEKGKTYTVYITATVSSVEGTTSRMFQIEAEMGLRQIKKNVAITNFPVLMLNASGAELTALSTSAITCAVLLDGGSFTNIADTVNVNKGNGWYALDLSASETNGDKMTIRCTASGARTYYYTVFTQH